MFFTKNFRIGWFVALAGLVLGAWFTPSATAQPGVRVPVQAFYEELAPYGRWLNNPQYGQVWVPQVEADFQPYATAGRWVMTEYGNTWESDYDWGWAPFHYGRWLLDDYYGWIWVPGDEWAPAWVSWRSGGGYYGWAPLGPGFHVNINVNLPWRYWTFVPQRFFNQRNPYRYCVPRTRVVNVYQNTTIINNYYRNDRRSFAYGPQRQEIERVTQQRVPVYRVNELGRRGGFARNENRYDRDNRLDRDSRNDRFETPRQPRNRPDDQPDSRPGLTNDRRDDSPSRFNRPDGFDRPTDAGLGSRADRPRRSGEAPFPNDRGTYPTERREPIRPAQPPSEPGAPLPGTYQRRPWAGGERTDSPHEMPQSQPRRIESVPNGGEHQRPNLPARGGYSERPERAQPQREVGPRPEMQNAPREPGQDNRGRRSRGGA